MHRESFRTTLWGGALTLTLSIAGCGEQALSSRADRRLDIAESRFDSLEARVERLERALLADSARTPRADTVATPEARR